jgi:hypothetical protein
MKQGALIFSRTLIILFSIAGIIAYGHPWISLPFLKPYELVFSGKNIVFPVLLGLVAVLAFVDFFMGKGNRKLQYAILLFAVANLAFTLVKVLRLNTEYRWGLNNYFRLALFAAAGIMLFALAMIIVNSTAPSKESAENREESLMRHYAAFVLKRSGKLNMLEAIMERCKKDNISVRQHFTEGLVKRYELPDAKAKTTEEEWYNDFQEAELQERKRYEEEQARKKGGPQINIEHGSM